MGRKNTEQSRCFYVAERGGFEPPIPCGIRAFQARALGRYATSPRETTLKWSPNAPRTITNFVLLENRGIKRLIYLEKWYTLNEISFVFELM